MPMLRKLEYWGALSPRDQGALLDLPHTLRTIDARQHIVREGDRTTHSCMLRSGFAFRQKIVGDGGRQLNRTLKGLERDELITRSSRSVIIENWKSLAAAGDFQSGYLHLRLAQLTITR
ncbi:MAG TPA: hypothetical protein VF759_06040 [Allosphingosinicella sp.]